MRPISSECGSRGLVIPDDPGTIPASVGPVHSDPAEHVMPHLLKLKRKGGSRSRSGSHVSLV